MSTQGDYLTEIADAIRYKDLTTPTIQASTFADRIMALKCIGWEYPSDWPDPQTLINNAITDAADGSIVNALVYFMDSSEETYTFYGAKYIYGSDGQKITGSGGTASASITFDGESYELKADGRAIRWCVVLQDINADTAYLGVFSTTFPVSCINVYVNNTSTRLSISTNISPTSTYTYQLESFVFGRPNTDGENNLYIGTNSAIFSNLSAFIAIVNAKIVMPSGVRSMTNFFGNNLNMKKFPVLEITGTNQYYSPINMGKSSYALEGTAYVPISAYSTSNSFQGFFEITGADTIHFNNSVSSIRVTNFTYALRYAQNLKKITCDSALTINIATSPLYMGEFAYSLETIEPVLDCTNFNGSGILSLFNNDTGTQTRNFAIKDIKLILSPTYSVNLTRTLHCANIASWEFLANNAPDVSGSPITLTIGSYLINKLNGTTEGQAVLSTLIGKGWVIA